MGKTKYIDAEAFKRRILSYGTVHEGDRIQIPFYKRYFAEAYVAILRWVCEEVDDTPAADVAEVCRCKDCTKERTCNFVQYHGADGYCSYGVRRNG